MASVLDLFGCINGNYPTSKLKGILIKGGRDKYFITTKWNYHLYNNQHPTYAFVRKQLQTHRKIKTFLQRQTLADLQIFLKLFPPFLTSYTT